MIIDAIISVLSSVISALGSLLMVIGSAIKSFLDVVVLNVIVPIGVAITAGVKAILSGFKYIIVEIIWKSLLAPSLSAIKYVMVDILWKQIIVGFIWDVVIVDMIWEGFIYGLLWVKIIRPAGLLGWAALTFFAVRLWELFVLVSKMTWYGPAAHYFSFRESLFANLTENPLTSPTQIFFAFIFGLGFGIRALLASFVIIPYAAWFGILGSKKFKFLSDEWRWDSTKNFEDNTNANNDYSCSFIVGLLGSTIGLVIGWRGVFKLIFSNILPLILRGFYLGLFSFPKFLQKHLHWTLEDYPYPPGLSKIPFLTGSVIGLIFGLRFYVNVLYLIPSFIYHHVMYILKGSFYGFFPKTLHCIDSPINSPPQASEIYKTPYENVVSRFIFGIFGLGIGFRSILSFIILIPYAAFLGPFVFKGRSMISQKFAENVPKTLIGKTVAFIFGLVIGWRWYVVGGWLMTKSVTTESNQLILGAWYGLSDQQMLDEGFFDLKPFERSINHKVGAILLGLGFGWRVITNFLLVVCKANIFGFDPEKLHHSDGLLGKAYNPPKASQPSAPSPEILESVAIENSGTTDEMMPNLDCRESFYKSPKITPYLSILSGFIGLYPILNFLTALGVIFYYGINPYLFHPLDSVLSEPSYTYKSPTSKYLSLPLGVIGLRSIIAVISAMPKALYLGIFPEFFQIDGHLSNDLKYRNRIIGVILGPLGLIIGFRCIFNVITMIPSMIIYGVSPELNDIIRKHAGIIAPLPFKPYKSITLRAFGIIFGIFFGFGTFLFVIIDLLQGCLWIFEGMFFGYAKSALICDDGCINSIFTDAHDIDFSNPHFWFTQPHDAPQFQFSFEKYIRSFLYAVGSAVFGFVGFVTVLNTVSVIFVSTYKGLFAKHLLFFSCEQLQTNFGKFCTLFGGFIGLSLILDFLYSMANILIYGVGSIRKKPEEETEISSTICTIYATLFCILFLTSLIFLSIISKYSIPIKVALCLVSVLLTVLIIQEGICFITHPKFTIETSLNFVIIILGACIYLPIWPILLLKKLFCFRHFLSNDYSPTKQRKKLKAFLRIPLSLGIGYLLYFLLKKYSAINGIDFIVAVYGSIVLFALSTVILRKLLPIISIRTINYREECGGDKELIEELDRALKKTINSLKWGTDGMSLWENNIETGDLKPVSDQLAAVRPMLRDWSWMVTSATSIHERTVKSMYACLQDGRYQVKSGKEVEQEPPTYQTTGYIVFLRQQTYTIEYVNNHVVIKYRI